MPGTSTQLLPLYVLAAIATKSFPQNIGEFC